MARGVAVNGSRIEQERKKLLLERKEFAAMVGISDQTLFQIERTRNRTAMKTLRKLAQALDVPPSDLMQTEDAEESEDVSLAIA